ncbi:MAG TPA: SgcJ/EcaC family oxidoreductase [Herpetosiphonaceae bacterium]
MSTQPDQSHPARAADEREVRALYQQLLSSWNERNAHAFAALFSEDGHSIGFDGSAISGQAEIESHIRQIFSDHQTGTYVGKIRDVRFLGADIALLRAVCGMIPPGQADLNPAVNTIQTVVAVRHDQTWRVELFQNTPAQFHGRPDLVRQLTDELRELLT